MYIVPHWKANVSDYVSVVRCIPATSSFEISRERFC